MFIHFINKFIKVIIFTIALLYSYHVYAVVHTEYVSIMNWFEIEGPADQKEFIDAISVNGSAQRNICNSSAVSYDLGRIDYVPNLSYVGSYYPTSAHDVVHYYDLGVQGLRVSPKYATGIINQPGQMENNIPFYSATSEEQILWKGNTTNQNRISSQLIWRYQTVILKGAEQLKSGVYDVPQTLLYHLKCYDTSGTLQEVYNFNVSSFRITVKVTTCTPNESSKIIRMDGIPVSTINNAEIGELLGTKQQNFGLVCDPNILLTVSINDLVDPSNIGTTIAKTQGGGATGVGYIVTSGANSTGLRFSAPGTVIGTPNVFQYVVTTNTGSAARNMIDYNLGFSYIKTDHIVTEGEVKSIIGLTYSYQ